MPAWEHVDSGKDCAKAEGRCGGGVCNAKVKNDCDAAVRCDLAMSATCDNPQGNSAASGGDHATIAAHESGEIDAQVTCTSGPIVHTEIVKLACK
jgi:hypothetical protein